MLIECIIPRVREVLLGDTAYKFLPDDQLRYVCEVESPEHCDILLAIRCYRRVEGESEQPLLAAAPLLTLTPGVLTPIVEASAPAVVPTVPADTQSEDEADEPEQNTAAPAPAVVPAVTTDTDRTRDELAAQYKAKFGKLPNGRLSAERIQQILEQA